MSGIIGNIRRELRKNADEKTKKSTKRFFKEKIKVYGLKASFVFRLGKKYWKEIKDKNKKKIFYLCEKLWQSGFMEESFIACGWSYNIRKDYKPEDFKTFEKWVNAYISNWATCDTFCNHTVGEFLEMYPGYLSRLKKWAKSQKRWARRASAVSLIIPAKKGKFLNKIFEIADTLLLNKDEMVQKGYGWMLKAATKMHEKEVFRYVLKNKKIMPRTALRYAIEKMPKKLKMKAMKK
jgi:3-methyladenine DNA glycosylase AlkD